MECLHANTDLARPVCNVYAFLEHEELVLKTFEKSLLDGLILFSITPFAQAFYIIFELEVLVNSYRMFEINSKLAEILCFFQLIARKFPATQHNVRFARVPVPPLRVVRP